MTYVDDTVKPGHSHALRQSPRGHGETDHGVRLAIEAGRLTARPHIPKLREAPPRQGFMEHGEDVAIREHFPAHYHDALDFGPRRTGAGAVPTPRAIHQPQSAAVVTPESAGRPHGGLRSRPVGIEIVIEDVVVALTDYGLALECAVLAGLLWRARRQPGSLDARVRPSSSGRRRSPPWRAARSTASSLTRSKEYAMRAPVLQYDTPNAASRNQRCRQGVGDRHREALRQENHDRDVREKTQCWPRATPNGRHSAGAAGRPRPATPRWRRGQSREG